MKGIFVTDLHGCKWKYNRLLEVAKSFHADIVINGGDMLPNDIELFKQGEFIVDFLDSHFSQFNSERIYYLCYLGNDDLKVYDDIFEEICDKYEYIINIAQRQFRFGEYEFIGMNWIVDYPFRLKDRCRMDTEDYMFPEQLMPGLLSTQEGWFTINDWIGYAKSLPTIENELDRLIIPKDMDKTIYIMHMPPYQLGLDKCYHGEEVGSKAIYNFLKTHQPLMSLHGHIHEAPDHTGRWFNELGDTICIQPGQLEKFTYVTIDFTNIEFNRVNEKNEHSKIILL